MANALGGFGCSRNALISLNVLYVCVAFILMGVAGYGIAASSISPVSVIIAIVLVSIFLLMIAVIGIVAAVKHHQVMLFFYMVILFLLFVVQFSVACACLAMGDDQIITLMETGWANSKDKTRESVQEYWDCCDFTTPNRLQATTHLANSTTQIPLIHTTSSINTCSKLQLPCCAGSSDCASVCYNCYNILEKIVKDSLRLCGGISLFFSFTEIVGIFIALRFRNQKNPDIDPADFL